jgi:acyl-CoA synthetase (NDP forming)
VVPEFDEATQLALRNMAGPNAGVSNPVDLGAGATPQLFGSALQIALGSPTIDGAIVILAPVASASPEDVASVVAAVAAGQRPIIFVHLGKVEAPAALSGAANPIPCYAFPERAVRALGHVADHSDWMQRSVGRVPDLGAIDLASGRSIVDAYLSQEQDGGWLPSVQTADLLRAFGIPTVAETRAASAAEAAAAAREFGGAVALKAFGDRILHKSDIGAVRLDLTGAEEMEAAFVAMSTRLGDQMEGAVVQPMLRGVELIAGVVSDPLFGPVVMFGSGGTAVELFADRVLRILPLTDRDAHEMVRSIRGAPLLFGHRGTPWSDVAAVEDVLLRVARMADAIPQLAEMDLNPFIATPLGAVVVDARLRLVPWRRHSETEVRRLR